MCERKHNLPPLTRKCVRIFGRLWKKCSINFIGRDSWGFWLKKFTLHDIRDSKLCNIIMPNEKEILIIYHYKTSMIFFLFGVHQSSYQSNWLNIFTQLSKFFPHFRDRGGKVRFLAHPCNSLKNRRTTKLLSSRFSSWKDFSRNM